MGRNFVQHARAVWIDLILALTGLAGIIILLWLVYHSLIVVMMLAIALVLALLLNPLVERLSARIPRWAAIVIIYVGIIATLILLGVWLIPVLVNQGRQFNDNQLPDLKQQFQVQVQKYTSWYQFQASDNVRKMVDGGIEQLHKISTAALDNLLGAVKDVLSWLIRGIIILVMSIYLLLDRDNFTKWFYNALPSSQRVRLQVIFKDVQQVLGAYLRGLMVMVLFVGISVSTVLWLCHIKYWLFIGVIAGCLEVIPYFGAFSGAIPAVTLGFQHNTATGVGLIVFFIAINQIEGHVVAPLAMGHHMHMRPLTVLLSLLVGAEVKGAIGMIIAVPLLGIVRVLWAHARRYAEQSLNSADPTDTLPHPETSDGVIQLGAVEAGVPNMKVDAAHAPGVPDMKVDAAHSPGTQPHV